MIWVSCVLVTMSAENLEKIADDLISQVEDQYADKRGTLSKAIHVLIDYTQHLDDKTTLIQNELKGIN